MLADTAGRLHTKVNLMEELKKVRRVAERARRARSPRCSSSSTPPPARTASCRPRQFTEAVEVTGVVLTKLDGTAKGGIALAIQTELGIPIKLVGLGETPTTSSPSTPTSSSTPSSARSGYGAARRAPATLSLSMFDSLSDRFEGIFTRLRGRGRLGEAEVDEVLREIRLALLEADVNFKVVQNFVGADQGAVRRRRPVAEPRARPSRSSRSSTRSWSTPSAARRSRSPTPPSPPTVVLLAGLQGSGKTTAAGKLARWFKQQGRNPLLVGADLQRPAAVEQLRILGQPGRRAGVQRADRPGDGRHARASRRPSASGATC